MAPLRSHFLSSGIRSGRRVSPKLCRALAGGCGGSFICLRVFGGGAPVLLLLLPPVLAVLPASKPGGTRRRSGQTQLSRCIAHSLLLKWHQMEVLRFLGVPRTTWGAGWERPRSHVSRETGTETVRLWLRTGLVCTQWRVRSTQHRCGTTHRAAARTVRDGGA